MRSQHFQSQYTPKTADPPQQPAARRPVFPRSNLTQTDSSSQTSEKARIDSRRRYHADFQHDSSAPKEWPLVRNRNGEYGAGTHPVLCEMPEFMREKQEGAALVVGMNPTPPHLHPCDSPREAVSPLTLEEARDYFCTEARLATMTPTMGSSVVSGKGLRTSVKEKSKEGPENVGHWRQREKA
jgi:hypothetical protein